MVNIAINYNDGFKQQVIANGSSTGDYDFPVLDAEHLTVIRTDSSGVVQSTYTDGSGITVNNVGNAAGGTYTLTTPANGTDTYTALLDVPEERTSDFNQAGDFFASVLNEELDLITQQIQQLRRDVDKSARFRDDLDITGASIDQLPTDGAVLQYSGTDGKIINGPTVDEITNAETYATNASSSATAASNSATDAANSATSASNSATTAAAAAAAGLFEEVVTITNADSPYEPVLADEGNLFRCDVSGGAITVNLDALADYGEDMKLAFVKPAASANSVTINRGGTDTISGGTSVTIDDENVVYVLVGDFESGTWEVSVQTAGIADGSVTFEKLAGVLDEDDMASDSATALATQQSIKAYVDNSTLGCLLNVQVFTSSGTWTPTAGTSRVFVEVVGGGGNGGSSPGVNNSGGGGGGAGGTAKKFITSGLGATETVTVGAAGGTSSFGSHCSASGGSVGTITAGGAGGIGLNGDINIRGGGGGAGSATNGCSGSGGSSTHGGGGRGVGGYDDIDTLGQPGGSYGGGGSGGYRNAATQSGGAGASGVVIVYEYS